MASKKFLVILAGCGVFDGAEINESVLTLLALDRAGITVDIAAPNITQHHTVNHQSGTEDPHPRNCREEAARIARGPVMDLAEAKAEEYNAIVVPGGFGAAKNLCNFAVTEDAFEVIPPLAQLLTSAQEQGKVIGLACIAPAIGAKLFGNKNPRLTIGTDPGTAARLTKEGCQHVDCPVDQCVTDENLRLVTTPAYMLAQRITEAEKGINVWIKEIIRLST